MQIRKCINCMSNVEDSAEICPYCGFDHRKYTHSMQALPLGTMLHGRYIMGRVLGQGGFGITYAALDTLLNIRVAVKEYFLRSEAMRVPGSTQVRWWHTEEAAIGRECFLKEARKMAKIKDVPNVVNVQDVFAENDTAYLVMDYIKGITLMERLEREGVLTLKASVALMAPVMDTLHMAHQRGLIHRDISPDNIMLSENGVPFLLDLGAAKDLAWSNGHSRQVAKKGFSPPEQYTQGGEIGPWMDVYAMSATILFLITGKQPPDALPRMFEDHLDLSPLPSAAAAVLKKGMALSNSDRYQSMAEFKKALETAVEGGKPRLIPKHAFNLGGEQHTLPFSKTAKRLFMAGAIALVLTGMIAGIFQLNAMKRDSAAAAEKKRTEESYENSIETEQTVYVEKLEETQLEADPEAQYAAALSMMEAGKIVEAGKQFAALGDYQDARIKAIQAYTKASHSIGAGRDHSVGLKSDGTVLAAGSTNLMQCKTSDWADIIAVTAGHAYTIGLKSDGTVEFVGDAWRGQRDIMQWTDITEIASRFRFTVGLKSDGTVVAAGSNGEGQCNTSEMKDIVAIAAGNYHTVGLKADGTVVAVGSNANKACNVYNWTDIAAIAAGGGYTIGLKADGTVVAAGTPGDGQCDVSEWTDIVAVSAGDNHTVGLKADGTVVAVGQNKYGQCNVSEWKDIVAIAVGWNHTIGLKSDGTVVATGGIREEPCRVVSWRNILVP